MFWKKIWQSKN